MVALKTRAAVSPADLAQRLFKLERCGRYEDALDEASYIWPDRSVEPNLDEFPIELAAELRLRLAALLGFNGNVSLEKGSQDMASDMLGQAKRVFQAAGWTEKVAECDNYIALNYWRKGALDEAEIMVNAALDVELPLSSPVRLHSYIIKCLNNMPNRTGAENLTLLNSVEDGFWQYGDDCLKGDFFNHRGIAYDNTGQPEAALKNFELARLFFRRARHRNYLGSVENNLAWFFKKHGDFARAHEMIDSAVQLHKSARDKTREGYSLDTKAALFLAEGRRSEALNCVNRALGILANSENSQYRVDTFGTKCSVLLEMGNFQEAVLTLMDAVDLARERINEKAARRVIDDFEKAYMPAWKRKKSLETRESTDKLNLLLPAELAHYSDYRGMRVTNDRLLTFGLEAGSLAIIACCDVERGDLAVVSTIDTEEVSCGIYDEFAGIISLDDPAGGEPRLFDKGQVRILGKIVGRADESVLDGNRIPVGPLVG